MEILINALKLQAEMFLKEFGEFFPFATAIGLNNEVIPISIYSEDEKPESITVINELEKAIMYFENKKRYKIVGICTDVLFKLDDNHMKTDALELRIDGVGLNRINIYITYKIENNHIEFGEIYEKPGTLIIWDKNY